MGTEYASITYIKEHEAFNVSVVGLPLIKRLINAAKIY